MDRKIQLHTDTKSVEGAYGHPGQVLASPLPSVDDTFGIANKCSAMLRYSNIDRGEQPWQAMSSRLDEVKGIFHER